MVSFSEYIVGYLNHTENYLYCKIKKKRLVGSGLILPSLLKGGEAEDMCPNAGSWSFGWAEDDHLPLWFLTAQETKGELITSAELGR